MAIHLLQPGPAHVVRRNFALEVEADHDRLPGHVGDQIEYILSQLAPLDELYAAHANSFVAYFSRFRRISSWRMGADVRYVDESGAPSDQLIVQMDRRDGVHVGLMYRSQGWIVDQKHIVREKLVIRGESFDNAAHGHAGTTNMPGHGVSSA